MQIFFSFLIAGSNTPLDLWTCNFLWRSIIKRTCTRFQVNNCLTHVFKANLHKIYIQGHIMQPNTDNACTAIYVPT